MNKFLVVYDSERINELEARSQLFIYPYIEANVDFMPAIDFIMQEWDDLKLLSDLDKQQGIRIWERTG